MFWREFMRMVTHSAKSEIHSSARTFKVIYYSVKICLFIFNLSHHSIGKSHVIENWQVILCKIQSNFPIYNLFTLLLCAVSFNFHLNWRSEWDEGDKGLGGNQSHKIFHHVIFYSRSSSESCRKDKSSEKSVTCFSWNWMKKSSNL